MCSNGDIYSEGLQKSLENILNDIDAYIHVTDMDNDEILFVNKKIKDTFNFEHEFSGKKCWQIFQKGFNERCSFCPVFQLEKDPTTPVVWEELNTVTGRYYKNVDSVIDWVDGRRVHLQYAIDITETKTAQHDAVNMLGILKNILNGMDAYVYVSDMETDEILFINNRMKNAFGLTDAAVGSTCWKVLQDGFSERCSFCPNFSLEKTPDVPVVWEEHNTVTKRHYKNVDSVIEWMDGKKVHMQHSTDITDILEAQGETKAVRERLETALSSSKAGVWEISFETNLLSYDAVSANLFGLDPENGTMHISELIAHLEKTMVESSGPDLLQGLRDSNPYSGVTVRVFHLNFPDGSIRYVRNHGNTIRDKTGKAQRVIGMCIDITPQVTMENELMAAKNAAENASRAKSQFLSNMSHEIRTPMNAIIGMTDILLNDDLSDRHRSHLHDIKVSSTALLGIINDILDFSKIEAGKLQIHNVDYDIMQLLKNIGSMFTFSAKKKGISFALDIQGDIPECLYGDDIRLRQVLVNVVGNAVKFTQSGGVTLRVGVESDNIFFDVIDTGVGIKPEEMPNIFNDFDRLDLHANRAIAGTGLGLSITKNLVSMMGGAIHVESEYGKGSVFSLEFPLVFGDASRMVGVTAEPDLIDAPDANVLVVDDTEVNLHVAAGLLRLYGITCDTALSGQEAIDKIATKKYDIIFMDHMMPGMDGVETTRKLRETYDMDSLVVIALTANAVEGAREMLLNAKMNDYLSKPIDGIQLNNILLKWLPAEKLRQKKREKEPAAAQEISEQLQRVASIEGVDVRLGLERIGGLQDAYETSLGIFARRLPGVLSKLSSFLQHKDAVGFSIEVHGLKGSLNNIGATSLAATAEALERKSKVGDLRFCEENLPALDLVLTGLHEKLSAALSKNAPTASSAPAGDSALLRQQLTVVRELLNAFEGDEALAITLKLSEHDYGATINEILKQASVFIEEFEYERAMAALEAL